MEGITTVKVLRLSLMFFFGLIVSLAPLKAQVVITNFEPEQQGTIKPGEQTTLILHGKGFLKMEHIKVRIDNFDISVLGDPIIESDSVAKINIQIPSRIQTQPSHKITVRASGEGFARWTQLKPLPIDGQNSSVVDSTLEQVPFPNPQPFAKIEILPQAGDTTTAGMPTLINFGTAKVGSPVTRTLNIHNAGTALLKLTNPELPDAFKLLTSFPLHLQPGKTAPLVVQLKAETANSFNGTLQFNSNVDDQNPFFLRLQGTVNPLPPPPSPGPFDSHTKMTILIVMIITFIFVSLFLAKNIFLKRFIKIKPVKDFGSQQIQQNNLIKSDAVLQIEPFFDYGEPVVEVKDALIREKKKTNHKEHFRERAKLSLK